MAWTHKLRFAAGGTITGQRPGEKIRLAVEEIQKKTITRLKSAAPGLAFLKRGKNEWELVSKDDGGQGGLLQRGEITNNATKGDAKIRYVGGKYYLDIQFPRVNRTTTVEIQPES